jgi:mannose-1-phosphate guanylyltransferase
MRGVHVVVLAGGAGTRFWPASRAARPKQLLPLCSDAPMISDTVRRIRPLVAGPEAIWVATGAPLAEATRAAVPDLREDRLLLEPAPRNTAPCIAWASASIERVDPDAVVIVLPSDHHVGDEAAFLAVLERAIASARGGVITTIGVAPTRPETGFGYIELAAPLPEGGRRAPEALPGLRFVEKPDAATAARFVDGRRHLWNAGMFVFRARDLRAAIRAHVPAIAGAIEELDRAAAAGGEAAALARLFPLLPSVSVDVGVMEKLERFAVVPGEFGWSDVGSWQSAWELAPRDEDENHGPEHAIFVDSARSHVVDLRADAATARRAIALVGVQDLVLVETDDGLLVVPRTRAQDVRLAVEALRAAGKSDLV